MGNTLKKDGKEVAKADDASSASTEPKRPESPGGKSKKKVDVKIDRRLSTTTAKETAKEKDITVEDFDLLKVLGKGSFGKVMLVRKKDTGILYAMKTLRKANLIKRNQIDHTKAERSILQHLQHPYIVNLNFAFQTDSKLYLVLDFVGGGELFFWLKQARKFDQKRGCLYGGEILLALEHLHKHDIIYRDLKPENILMGLDGHLKLTDFGLSKEGVTGFGADGGTKTFCGTPEYLAPEILMQKGHGKAVDWWSLGILIFEMLNGSCPFYDANHQRMYQKILRSELTYPAHFSAETVDLLSKLIDKNDETRLGSGPGDGDEIKTHAFWKSIDWAKLSLKQVEPTFVPPKRRGTIDVSNFDTEFTREMPVDSVVTTNLSDDDLNKLAFEGFSYVGKGMGSTAGKEGADLDKVLEEEEEDEE